MYSAIRQQFNVIETGEIIQNFVNQNRETINKYLVEYKNNPSNKIKLSSHKSDHQEWFAGKTLIDCFMFNLP